MPNQLSDKRTFFPGFLLSVNYKIPGSQPRISAIFDCSMLGLLDAKAHLLSLYAILKNAEGELRLSLHHADCSEIAPLPVQVEWIDVIYCVAAYEKHVATNDLAAWTKFDARIEAKKAAA